MSEKFRTQIHPQFVPLRCLDCQMSDLLRVKINAAMGQSSQHKGKYESGGIEPSKWARWTEAFTWSYSVRKIVSRFSHVMLLTRLDQLNQSAISMLFVVDKPDQSQFSDLSQRFCHGMSP